MRNAVILLLINIGYIAGHGDHFEDTHADHVEKRLLLLSFDGFRWDYLKRLSVNGTFHQLVQGGAYAPKGIENAFITKTLPNHYSMVTGLYEESHGIIANFMYNETSGKYLNPKREGRPGMAKIFHGEPIWQTYGKQAKGGPDKVGCCMFFGCGFAINGVPKLNHVMRYVKSTPWKDRVDTVIRWLRDADIQLALLYFHEPDWTGHRAGPESAEMDKMLLQVENNLKYLIDQLKYFHLFDQTNLIITSDHGMLSVNQFSYVTRNTTLFDIRVKTDVEYFIDAKPGKMNEAISFLKSKVQNAKVYRKEDLPDRWHYKHSDKMTNLLLLADPGFIFGNASAQQMNDHVEVSGGRPEGLTYGTHGYDNKLQEMRPIFIAHGPDFKPGSVVPSNFKLFDIYNLMCHILDLQPAANNGSRSVLQSFRSFVRKSDSLLLNSVPGSESWLSLSSSLLVVLASCMFAVLVVLSMFAYFRVTQRRFIKIQSNQNNDVTSDRQYLLPNTGAARYSLLQQSVFDDVSEDEFSVLPDEQFVANGKPHDVTTGNGE